MEFPTRRAVLATAAAAAIPGFAAAGYQLGCMTSLYGRHPMARALAGIRKAGYRYICPGRSHADLAFTEALSSSDRAQLRRMIKDQDLTPNLSLGGFSGEVHKPEGFAKYIRELDLCAEFGIPVMVGGGPWYYQKFPTVPKRDTEWQQEVARFYSAMEKAVRHAESVKVTIALKPHTGITARAKDCIEVSKRISSERFKICWDAGNVSFYEGIYPDPDLPDLAPAVRAVCIKDHLGGRAENNFPVPGNGQIDHEAMFRTLFGAGFNGPMSIELLNGRDRSPEPETVDERTAAANRYLTGLLDRIAPGA